MRKLRLRETSEGYRAARVKRCGKSAPAGGATRLARQTPPGARPNREHELVPARYDSRVGCLRRRATAVLEEWPSVAAATTKPGLQALFWDFIAGSEEHGAWSKTPGFLLPALRFNKNAPALMAGAIAFQSILCRLPQKPEADLKAGWLEKGDVWPVLATAGAGC